MKKIFKNCLIGLLTFVMILSLCSCGDGKSQGENEVGASTEKTASSKNDTKKLEGYDYTYRCPDKNIYFNRPYMQVIKRSYTTVFKMGGNYFIAFNFDDDISCSNEEIIDQLLDNYLIGLKGTLLGNDFIALDKTSEDNIKLNSVDAYCFEGIWKMSGSKGSVRSTKVKGYTFNMDGCACEIVGFATGEPEEQCYAEMVETLDNMMSTLRSAE